MLFYSFHDENICPFSRVTEKADKMVPVLPGSNQNPGLKNKRETRTVMKEKKIDSSTEGELSHARISIAHHRD